MGKHELKYIFPVNQSDHLLRWLMSRCYADGDHPQNIISSVYYDTVDWNFLGEKINSDYLKTKYRLRWYQDVETLTFSPKSYFEKKQKIGSSRRKQRVELDLDTSVKEARYLNDRYFTELPTKIYTTELTPVRAILPVFQISYVRYRLVDKLSGARLAVDTNIHVPRINPSMVKRTKTSALQYGVFECKSGAMNLPDWLHGVATFGCRKNAFSKYSNCYEHITGLPV